MWKKIFLSGGKAMISNSFGKRVPFVLEPCGLMTPKDCDDNYICGSCVRDNEEALRCKGSSRVLHSSAVSQEPDDAGKVVTISCPAKRSVTLSCDGQLRVADKCSCLFLDSVSAVTLAGGLLHFKNFRHP